MLTIVNAIYQDNYKIALKFNDEKNGIVDLEEFIFNTKFKPFKELKSIEKFKSFRLDYTLKWGEDLDLAPEYLYFKTFENDKELQIKFKEWGYK